MNLSPAQEYQSVSTLANAILLVKGVIDETAGNDVALPADHDINVSEMIAAKLQVRLAAYIEG